MKLDQTFWSHTVWSYTSFFIIAFSGFAINVSIGATDGANALGVFNQVYAIFIIVAQCATFAIYDSALKHMAEYSASDKQKPYIATAAFFMTICTGCFAGFSLYLFEDLIAFILGSPDTAKGLAYASIGVALFTINKILLGVLNGERRMRFYCTAQASRVVVILLGVLWVNHQGLDIALYGLCFTIAEIIIFPFLTWAALPDFRKIKSMRKLVFWSRKHFHFGRNAFLNGLMIDSYMRVDIIMLGIFLSDEQVGIYSLAAIFIEGLIQIAAVVRNLANPILVKLLIEFNLPKLKKFMIKMSSLSFTATFMVGGMICLVFPHLTDLLDENLLHAAHPILVLLFFGVAYFSLFIPADHILLQSGKPHKQSKMMTLNILINIILNAILIPQMGLYGAAIATILSFFYGSLNLMVMSRKNIFSKGFLIQEGF